MQFFYETLALHDLGDVAASTSRDYEGGDAPQRCKVTIRLRLDVFEEAYSANAALIGLLKEKLRLQQGVFVWRDSDTGNDYVNQTVTLVSHDAPDDPNAWGSYHQQVNLTFCYYEHDLLTQNLPLVFRPTPPGGTGPILTVPLGNVTKWDELITVERRSPMHSERTRVEKKIIVRGLLLGNPKIPLPARRTELLAMKAKLDGLAEKDGLLEFGDNGAAFKQQVRVAEVTAEVDQVVYAIPYTFTCFYTLFPDEEDYAQVEFSVEQKDGQTGEQFLTFSGRILANTEAKAREKLEALTTVVRTQYEYVADIQFLPETTTAEQQDADIDGLSFMALTFSREYRRWRADNKKVKFKKTGATGPAKDLGNTRLWTQDYSANRFNEQRSHRRHAAGMIEASGTWCGDPALAVEARRTALIAKVAQMMLEVNGADGTLTYGTTDYVVRVERFHAEVNQAITGIDWSMTATYSLFPNDDGYATVEYTASPRQSVDDGEEVLSFTGRILAMDKPTAVTKLATVRTAVLAQFGFAATSQFNTDSAFNFVSANGDKTASLPTGKEADDGTTFIELTFNEQYRRRLAGTVRADVRRLTRDDSTTGLITTTYSGFVIATGATVSAAYAAALAKAQTLGANKETEVGSQAFLRSSEISFEQREVNTNPAEFLRLEFSYEYQSKIADTNRAYLELSLESNTETFGMDTQSYSGFIVAVDFASAATIYAGLKPANVLIRNERTNKTTVKAKAGTAIQELRFEFNFTVHVPKTTVAFKYGVTLERHFVTNTKDVRVQGQVMAANAQLAISFRDGLLAGMTSTGGVLAGLARVESTSTNDREWVNNMASSLQDYSVDFPSGSTANAGTFCVMTFDDLYTGKLSGTAAMLEMRLTEEVQYSGVNWVVQAVPRSASGTGGVSIPQDCGLVPGQRTVRGFISSTDRTMAETWAKQQQALLTGDADTNHYVQPPRIVTDFEFVPLSPGVPTGVSNNVKLWRVDFTFGELLPNYPMPP